MLARLRTIAQTAFALAGAVFFIAAAVVVLRVPDVLLHLDGTLTRFEAVESKVYATAQNIDAASATWSNSAKEETAAVNNLTAQALQTISETRVTLASAQTTIQTIGDQSKEVGPLLISARAATDRLGPAIGQVQDTVAGLQEPLQAGAQSLQDLDARISDPHISALLVNLDTTSGNAAAMSTDAQKKFHDLLYPRPCIGSWCWALTSWRVIKAGSNLMEPGYFLEQAIKNH